MSGKGSAPRPMPNRKGYESNWDAIFRKSNEVDKDKDSKDKVRYADNKKPKE